MVTHRIAFRVDASGQIGTGHFMRCLTLAEGLKQRGAQIRFISRHLPEYLRSMLLEKGYEFVLLNSALNDTPLDELAHAHWLGVSQAQDAADSYGRCLMVHVTGLLLITMHWICMNTIVTLKTESSMHRQLNITPS